ncbi:MAG: S8 family serine peptidase [Planctomycetaceae bacterium]
MFETLEDRRVLATAPVDMIGWTSAPHLNDQAMVRFNDNVTEAQARSLMLQQGASIVKYWPDLHMAQLQFMQSGTNDSAFLKTQSIHYMPEVKYAEPNFMVTASRTPNDPYYATRKWDLNNSGQLGPNGTVNADINAPEGWDKAIGNTNQVIAVLDTGIDYAHPDLAPNLWKNTGEIAGDGIDNDGNGYVDDLYGVDTVNADGDPFDGDGHGTHVSGIADARGDNGIGTVGVSWQSKLMAVKVLDDSGSGTTASVVAGIQYISLMKRVYGVDIVVANASLGGAGFSQAMFDAIQTMNTQNILMVAAAGNATTNNDSSPSYPASYNLAGIISVAATGPKDTLAPYSNFGLQSVDLAAPGGDMTTVDTAGIFSTYPLALTPTAFTQPGYEYLQGTSMATPQVAGAAAVIAGYAADNNTILTVAELKALILNGVDKLPSLTGRVATGGRLNLANSLSLFTRNEISGSVFRDSNGDGLRAPQEIGLANWRIYVDANGNNNFDATEISTLTDASGNFTLRGRLGPAQVTVRAVPQTGYAQTMPTNGAGYNVTLTSSSQTVTGLVFGEKPVPGSISGYKFNDYNKNGVRDAGEPGIAGTVIYVDMNNDGKIAIGEPAAVTDQFGFYQILAIDPGVYTLREVYAPGFQQTYPDPAGPDGGARVGVVVNAGVTTTDQNFGNVAANDWGDLPDSYKTTGGVNGPSHGILQGFQLGSRVDGESNGVPGANARGDDLNATASDEDGVDFLNFIPGSTTAQVRVRVNSGTFAPGYLSGWIDWNNDGTFGAGEQVISSQRLATGTYLFAMPAIPASPPLLGFYARFRYGTETNLNYYGPSLAGEVEDYLTGLERLTPLAVDDAFTVDQNSTNNKLHVLVDNGFGADQKSINGGPRIGAASIFVDATGTRGTVTYSDNGTASDFTDDYFAYTPVVGDIGTDTFKYKVQDDTGVFSDNWATVTVNIKAKPVPVDDTFTLPTAVATNLNVLANDGQMSGISASQKVIVAVGPGTASSQRPAGALVPTSRLTLNSDGTIRYTPPSASFVGTEFFTYTFAFDDDNNTATPPINPTVANVTVQVGAVANNATASIELRPYKITFVPNGSGGQTIVETLFNPTTDTLNVGDVMAVKAFTHDLRTPAPSFVGVEAAFLDLNFDTQYVQLYRNSTENDGVGNPLIPASGVNFPNTAGVYNLYAPITSGSGPFMTDTPGVLNEIGGFNSRTGITVGANPLSPVFVAYFKAVGATPTGSSTNFVADPAEETPVRDVLVKTLDTNISPDPQLTPLADNQTFLQSINGVQIRSTGAGEGEFSNPFNSLDVNGDGVVSAMDVLMIVNELNGQGPRALSATQIASLGQLLPQGYLDANVDAFLSPVDALMVINYLNSQIGAGEAAGEAGSAVVVSAASSGGSSSSSSSSSSGSDSSTLAAVGSVVGGSSSSSSTSSSSSSSESASQVSSDSAGSFASAVDSVLTGNWWTDAKDSTLGGDDQEAEEPLDLQLDNLLLQTK